MRAKQISYAQTLQKRVSALPTYPTNKSSLGGAGMSAADLKNAFDAFPALLMQEFNYLIGDILASPADSISAVMKTGIQSGHTLANLFEDLQNGNAATYIKADGKSLAAELIEIKEAIRALGGEI